MSDRFDFLSRQLDDIRRDGAFRSLVARRHEAMTVIQNGQKLVNFGSNDYLGLGSSRFYDRVSHGSDENMTSGAGASALVSGFTSLHDELCSSLVLLEQTEAAVVFPSGYAACSGTVATLPGRNDLLLSDALNHASLIDGCRLSPATRHIYRHGDVSHLESLLDQHRRHHDQAWIITDGVFGMDGDIAPLDAICDVADRFDVHVIVDEAHATGVLGPDGSGACAEMGVKSRVPIRIGTLSKAIGSHGGFVVGPRVVIDYLINRCRPLIFSTAGTPASIRMAIDAINVIRTDSSGRIRVRQFAQALRFQLGESVAGQNVIAGANGIPIVPVVLGDNRLVVAAASRLADAGYFVPAIRPPTVPQGQARLRISVTAAHSMSEVTGLAEALMRLRAD